MTRTSLRRYAVLAGLALFVAWFGVWEVYHLMAPLVGRLWAGVMAGLGALGLCVIVVVGIVMIRTRAALDGIPGHDLDGTPPGRHE